MADQNEVSSPNVARATEEHPVKQTQENMQSCKIRFLLPNDTSFTRDFEPQFTIARVKQSLLDDKPPGMCSNSLPEVPSFALLDTFELTRVLFFSSSLQNLWNSWRILPKYIRLA